MLKTTWRKIESGLNKNSGNGLLEKSYVFSKEGVSLHFLCSFIFQQLIVELNEFFLLGVPNVSIRSKEDQT